ncbi:MAG: DUF1294 domain-containing protein [Motiliproteus sp.]
MSILPLLPPKRLAVAIAITFLITVALAVSQAILPQSVLVFYLAVSLLTFVTYAVDKSAARNGTWRVPEAKLQLLALIGGWPGAVFGQQWLRHKSTKQPFGVVLWLMALLNGLLFAGLFTPTGDAMLHSLLASLG